MSDTKEPREGGSGNEVLTLLIRMQDQLHDVRDRLIRLESHRYGETLDDLKSRVEDTTIRVTVLETKGSVFAAGVAAAVSVGVSVMSGILVYALRLGH
jgi:hypothetical protein